MPTRISTTTLFLVIVATWLIVLMFHLLVGSLSLATWIAVALAVLFGFVTGKPFLEAELPLQPAIHFISIVILPIVASVATLPLVAVQTPASEWSWMIIGASLIAGARIKNLLRQMKS
jgi:hypothetical protein